MNEIDVRALIYAALLDDTIRADAGLKWAAVAADVLSRNHEREPGALRISDAGRCRRELWAELNGKRDLRDDPEGLLSRMNLGSLDGAWIACLLAAALEAKQYVARVEITLEHEGVKGHCDLGIYSKALVPLRLIECKMSMWTGAHDGPKPYHISQSGKYALGGGFPEFQVITHFPATQVRWDKTIGARVSEPHIFPSDVFRTDDYVAIVTKEYERLRGALAKEMPEGDPAEDFRCRSCRFSACERNANALNLKGVTA